MFLTIRIVAPSSAQIPNNNLMKRLAFLSLFSALRIWLLPWQPWTTAELRSASVNAHVLSSSRMRSWEVPLSAPSSGLASVSSAYSSCIGARGCQSRRSSHRMILLGGAVGRLHWGIRGNLTVHFKIRSKQYISSDVLIYKSI